MNANVLLESLIVALGMMGMYMDGKGNECKCSA